VVGEAGPKKKTVIPQNFSVVGGKVITSSGEELVGPEGVWKPAKIKKERRTGISRREEVANVVRQVQDGAAEAIEPVPEETIEQLPEIDISEGVIVGEEKTNKLPKIDGLPSARVIKKQQDQADGIEPVPPIEINQS
jgi:hypothetical protein